MQKSKHNQVHKDQGGNPDFVIEPLLPLGREAAVSTKELMTVLSMTEREIRAQVAFERYRGAIICSDTSAGGGYFKFETREELKAFYKGLQKKADSIYQALRSTKKALEEIEGQQVGDEHNE